MHLVIDDRDVKLDHYFKSLCFQRIMDYDLPYDQRIVLLLIFRKTFHFDKKIDTISNYQLTKKTGLSLKRARSCAENLEERGLIAVTRSNGGRGTVHERSHKYQLSKPFFFEVYNFWVNIKESNEYFSHFPL